MEGGVLGGPIWKSGILPFLFAKLGSQEIENVPTLWTIYIIIISSEHFIYYIKIYAIG